jgi:molybdopterin converting factor small subunit
VKVSLVFLEVEAAREIFGELRFTFDARGSTVSDLLDEIMDRYGSKSQGIFLKGGRYQGLQIIVNWKTYVLPEKMSEFTLTEGDTIVFAPLVDGG